MIDADLQRLAKLAAARFAIPAHLILGVIEVESSGDPYAWNPEPRYRYLWDIAQDRPFRRLTEIERASELPPLDFPAPAGVDRDAEWWGQQASWGLMQVMGAVAREHGFTGRHLPGLCSPAVGIGVGCQVFAAYLKRWGDPERAVAAYNAGSPRLSPNGGFENQVYVDKVLAAAGGWLITNTGA